MASLSVLPLLAALAAGLAARAPAAAPPEARVAVRAGRAELVQGEEIRTLTRASGTLGVAGRAFVELGPGAEVEVAWPGSASLIVRGPAGFEWEPEGAVRVVRAARVEAEVRRGERALVLSGGWTLALGRAAICVLERPFGDLLVEHRGGADLPVLRDGARRAVLTSGRSVLLSPAR